MPGLIRLEGLTGKEHPAGIVKDEWESVSLSSSDSKLINSHDCFLVEAEGPGQSSESGRYITGGHLSAPVGQDSPSQLYPLPRTLSTHKALTPLQVTSLRWPWVEGATVRIQVTVSPGSYPAPRTAGPSLWTLTSVINLMSEVKKQPYLLI